MHSHNTVETYYGMFKQMIKINTDQITFFIPYIILPATQSLNSITGGNLLDYMQLSLGPQKPSYSMFTHI